MTKPLTGYTPMDRLTRMGDRLTNLMPYDHEYRDGDRCIVFMSDDERAGIAITGYHEQREAVVELFLHLQAMFRAQGMDLSFVGIPESPEGIDD